MAIRKDKAQEFTNSIISMLETGELPPWRKKWASGVPMQNLKTKSVYRGINTLILWVAQHSQAFSSPFWLTFKQVGEMNGKVKKGSKGTSITYFQMISVEDKNVVDGTKEVPMRKFYTVFNLDQIEGIEAPKIEANYAEQEPERCKDSLSKYLMSFANEENVGFSVGGDQAYYSPVTDKVRMPEGFETTQDYAATLAHEFIHSTGHKSRCNRFEGSENGFTSHRQEYAFEELVAELGAGMLCASFGVDSDLVDHASYINSWLKALKSDKEFIFKAASKSQKAIDFIGLAVGSDSQQAA